MNQQSTILIVDDEPVGRRLLEVLLAGQGYHLVSASSGPEALTHAGIHLPDLILLDLMMPGMDGFEVCRQLRADPLLCQVPVVMVTALDDRDSRLHGIEVGADDFITKPVDRDELRKRVQTIIRLDRYRRLLQEREQRQQAEEAIRRRNRELTLLNKVIMTAATTLDVDSILTIACEALSQAFDMPLALALQLNETCSHVRIAAAHRPGLPHNATCLPTARDEYSLAIAPIPALTLLLKTPTPLAASDARTDERFASFPTWLGCPGLHAVVLVPIVMREYTAGYLALGAPDQRTLDPHDIALAQSIATAVGQAMETAQLHQRLRGYADELEELVRLRTRELQQRTLELQTERDRTQSILEALGEAVVVTDHDGKIEYINPAATRLTGFSWPEVLGQDWRDWQLHQQRPELYQQIQSSVRAGIPWRGELVQQRKDGTVYDGALTVAPIFDPNLPASLIGVVSVQRDITPLREADRLKNQFVSNVSHELRTPLSVITLLSGNLDTLYDRLQPARRQKMIKDIREHTRVLNDLINGILEISRIDSRRISTSYQPLNLAHILAEEVERQQPLAQRKQQLLSLRGADELMVQGSELQLRQIIRNLINNAIKYTPQAGQILCECQLYEQTQALWSSPAADTLPTWALLNADPQAVWPGSDQLAPAAWAALRIIDTGIGIAPEDLPHVFERFYRVQAQGNVPGTGLGLSIAQELVTLHSGHIALASLPDRGTVVAIYLPLVKEQVL